MDVEGFEVHAMAGASATLAKTRYLYVEFAPEQLHEQGSTVRDFVDAAERYFSSAYVVDGTLRFVPRGELCDFLLGLTQRRGLLLNLLLTHDTAPRSWDVSA